MTKPFLIVNVVEGELGEIRERPDYDSAVAVAVQMAAEQCDTPKTEIEQELRAGWRLRLAVRLDPGASGAGRGLTCTLTRLGCDFPLNPNRKRSHNERRQENHRWIHGPAMGH